MFEILISVRESLMSIVAGIGVWQDQRLGQILWILLSYVTHEEFELDLESSGKPFKNKVRK